MQRGAFVAIRCSRGTSTGEAQLGRGARPERGHVDVAARRGEVVGVAVPLAGELPVCEEEVAPRGGKAQLEVVPLVAHRHGVLQAPREARPAVGPLGVAGEVPGVPTLLAIGDCFALRQYRGGWRDRGYLGRSAGILVIWAFNTCVICAVAPIASRGPRAVIRFAAWFCGRVVGFFRGAGCFFHPNSICVREGCHGRRQRRRRRRWAARREHVCGVAGGLAGQLGRVGVVLDIVLSPVPVDSDDPSLVCRVDGYFLADDESLWRLRHRRAHEHAGCHHWRRWRLVHDFRALLP